jgi:hypothetical protein
MGPLPSAHPHRDEADFQRKPMTCLAIAVGVSTVFWAGLIWAAIRLYGWR